MQRSRRIRICREGVFYSIVFLAVLIGAVSRQLNLLMLVGCVMGGPILFSLLYGRLALRGVQLNRHLPGHIEAGTRLRVEVQVSKPRAWLGLWSVLVEDRVRRDGSAGAAARAALYFPFVPRRSTRQLTYEGTLAHRGRYYFGPLSASTRFPMGLVRHSVLTDSVAKLLVHPRLGRLKPGWEKMIREHESGSQKIARRGLLEADFYGLREWRPGDSRRWIHWRTSARRGNLIVRQFEQRRSQDLAILLDLWEPASATEQQIEAVETAISLVATLVAEACRKPGAQLLVDIAASSPWGSSGSGSPVFLREQMDALALLQPHGQTGCPARLGHALALVPASTPTFVISTRPIDWDGLAAAAAERDTALDSRQLVSFDVSRHEEAAVFQLAPAGHTAGSLQ